VLVFPAGFTPKPHETPDHACGLSGVTARVNLCCSPSFPEG
jgi:hypothetical protein